jgi:aryl-alcohol dehydrogenase-like predicted oxidoreductase
MRMVAVPPLGREVPVLGFGCASLGSRVSGTRGRVALDAAYAGGIRWFDVAPSYGDGDAEALLGSFIADRRAELIVCTKVGIVAPRPGLALRLAKPAVRLAAGAAPPLRRWVGRWRPHAARQPITPKLVEQSLEQSLARLATDHVDVIALHEPIVAEVRDRRVIEALERLVAKGRARAAGIAGAAEIVAAGFEASRVYRVGQLTDNPLRRGLAALRKQRELLRSRFVVTHSVFGRDGPLQALRRAIDRQPEIRTRLEVLGYAGRSGDVAAAALLDYALSSNAEGVVLVSSFAPGHLAANLTQASKLPDPGLVELLDRLMGAEEEAASVPVDPAMLPPRGEDAG